MKKIIILILLFAAIASISRGQNRQSPPDSLGFIQESDTTFRVIEGNSEVGYPQLQPPLFEAAFDSSGLANYVFNIIARNEDELRAALQLVLAKERLTVTYPLANSLLQRFSGEGYIPRAWGELQSQFAGFWQADSSNVTIYLRVFAQNETVNGTNYKARDVVRVNASGNPIGAVRGTFWGIRPGSFQTNSFFGATTGADGTRWVNVTSRRYCSTENSWVLTWLGRTFDEALEFLQLQNNN